jgi:8-oxo-dGTP pyrophosphatase MutT (NUDIX family)
MLTLIRERLRDYEAKTLESSRAVCAGVIIPVFENEGNLFIVLTKRTDAVRHHKGEVSFPGGMCEDGDRDTKATALRECCEEIGVRKTDVEVIGRLDDMETLTGFVITPYVGLIPYPYPFKISREEVEYLIYLPFEHLLVLEPGSTEAHHQGRIEVVSSFHYKGDLIWGATCRLLIQLKRICSHG